MTRALVYFGRSVLVLALCGFAAGCGDDDDSPKDAGPAGKGGSGGKGGTGGTGGTVSKAQCVTTATAASKKFQIPAMCLNCSCGKAAAVVASCGEPCWSVLACSAAKCGAVLNDEQEAVKCVTAMCTDEIVAAGDAQGKSAQAVGPILAKPDECAAECAPPQIIPPPEPDAGAEDDGGTDAGS